MFQNVPVFISGGYFSLVFYRFCIIYIFTFVIYFILVWHKSSLLLFHFTASDFYISMCQNKNLFIKRDSIRILFKVDIVFKRQSLLVTITVGGFYDNSVIGYY